jgi:glucosamine-6-phosphate deaminase
MRYGKTEVRLCRDAAALGKESAGAVARTLRRLLTRQPEVKIVFAAAESQVPFLDALAAQPRIAWDRVVCFNMDDFWAPRLPARLTCGAITRTHLYARVRPKAFHVVRHNGPDPAREARRFEALLRAHAPLDITCQGIGRSGHIALNEPGADFRDPRWVRVVDVAETSKQQLMEDPNFRELGAIPDQGITMTLPALLASRYVFTMVPLASKRPVLTRLFSTPDPIPNLPASILSTRRGLMFVDRDSCPSGTLRLLDKAAGTKLRSLGRSRSVNWRWKRRSRGVT